MNKKLKTNIKENEADSKLSLFISKRKWYRYRILFPFKQYLYDSKVDL